MTGDPVAPPTPSVTLTVAMRRMASLPADERAELERREAALDALLHGSR